MKGNVPGFPFTLIIGALVGVGATIWFFAQATQHVTTLVPPDVALPKDAPNVADRNRIMELACREVLASTHVTANTAGKVPSVYFLRIGDGQDPAPELLTALSDLPVQPYSAALQQDGRIKDRKTGAEGSAVTMRRMWMRERNEVYVQMRLGTDAVPRELVCTVAYSDGQWRVTRTESVK
jgi:hypothetical protein